MTKGRESEEELADYGAKPATQVTADATAEPAAPAASVTSGTAPATKPAPGA